ncbi:MAG: M20/M25/M40 family metallo-hydrolase [Deltaproteobacteria bacterium]|nr:M20/M25/M40 family metallo-hydrolase [Deltaproteobacteria bacterium]
MSLLLSLCLAHAVAAPIDFTAAGEETASFLQEYLRTDTVNPPGNELRGAELLADLMAREGIPWEIQESAPGRGNLVARLPGSGEEGALCLLSHIDVVDAEGERWPADRQPLSGVRDEEGVIWGRGALDMKSMGAIEAMTLVLLHRERVPLRRDVVLLAVADEEIHNTGMRYMTEHHWDELGCTHVVNEGGIGLADMFFDGQPVFPISTGEKGVLWLRMVATGEPGHGSVPHGGQAPERLLRAVERVRAREGSPHWSPEILELLRQVGEDKGGLAGALLQRPALVKTVLRGKLMGNPLTRAALTDTVNVTGFGGATSPNVVGAEAWAQLDCRLQPDTTAEAMLAELTALVDDPAVRFEVLHELPAAVSPQDDPLYRALERHTEALFPGAVAGPVLSVGFTDTIFARELGARGYGLEPFLVNEELLGGMHGDNERISVDNLTRGLEVLYRSVEEVSVAPGGAWIEPPLHVPSPGEGGVVELPLPDPTAP